MTDNIKWKSQLKCPMNDVSYEVNGPQPRHKFQRKFLRTSYMTLSVSPTSKMLRFPKLEIKRKIEEEALD